MSQHKNIDLTQPVYHGSDTLFEEFQHQQMNHFGGNQGGFGLYFSQNKDIAQSFASEGDNLYIVDASHVTLKNLRGINDDPNKMSFTESQVTTLLMEIVNEQAKKEGYPYILSDFAGEVSDNPEDWQKTAKTIATDLIQNTLAAEEGDVSLANELKNVTGDADLVGRSLTKIGVGYYEFYPNGSEEDPELVIFDPQNVSIMNVETVHLNMSKTMSVNKDVTSDADFIKEGVMESTRTHSIYDLNEQTINVFSDDDNNPEFLVGEIHDVLEIDRLSFFERQQKISHEELESLLYLERKNPNAPIVQEWMETNFGSTKNELDNLNIPPVENNKEMGPRL